MANASILAAFERMWQHVTSALSKKSDVDHNHDDKYADINAVITEETDPTVSDWAKQPSKPTYTADEVGAAPAYTYGTTDLVEGTSNLAPGTLYFVY